MQPPNPIIVFLKKIWPTVYRIINSFFYFLITLIKKIITLSIKQIKN